MPNCTICHTPNTTLCAHCRARTRHNLTWLTHNLNDLENYRINRAYMHHANGRAGKNNTTPTPLRENIHDLLYTNRDGNLAATLRAWAICLGETPKPGDPLARTAHQILTNPRLDTSSATPAYARELDTLVTQAKRIISRMDDTRIRLGTCLNPDCRHAVYAPADADTAQCDHCHNTWTRGILLKNQDSELEASDHTGTPSDLAAILTSMGIDIPASTIRTWAHRGKITPVDPEATSRRYRLADVYRHHRSTTRD